MAHWHKLPAWTGEIHQGCGSCAPVDCVAPLDMIIAVGFGTAQITKDNEIIFMEGYNDEDFRKLQEFEDMAKADPDHDWRALLVAPLREREYQRHDDDRWVLVHSGEGFA